MRDSLARKSPHLAIAIVLSLPTVGPAAAPADGQRESDASECGLPGDDKCEAWVAVLDDPDQGLDTPRNLSYGTQTVAVAPDAARVYVTGTSWGGDPGSGGTHYDYVTIAYDAATGAQLWLARYGGPGNSQDSAWALAVSPEGGRLYVTGMSHTGSPNWDYATVAYDAATGTQLWASRYDASSVDRAWSLALAPDGGRVFVTGDSGNNYGTVAYDAATGAQLWAASYNGPGAGFDVARFVGVSPDAARVFVTGRSHGGTLTRSDFATVAYDAGTGTQEWVARYNGDLSGDDWGYSLGVGPLGDRVYVTGSRDGSILTGLDYATIGYDAATGAQEWVTIYDGPGRSLDIPLSLAVNDADDGVFVTGYSSGSGTSYDYGTVAYDTVTGAEQWVARYNGPALNNSDIAYAVEVSPDDSVVYVTGESPPQSDADPYDIATVAYSAASGAQQWVARYDGAEHFQDGAFALAVSPDASRVYVNGETWHSATPGVGDYATLAYDTGIVVPSADLSLAKTDSADPAPTARNLTYAVTVRNNGPDPAEAVTVTDELPPSTTFVSSNSTQGTCEESEGTVACMLGGIGPGGTVTIDIVVRPRSAGTITNTASLASSTFDGTLNNNTVSEETTVCRRTSRRTSVPCG